ncbi:dipeptidyl-peptidase [Coprinellus micaceus]|uniref:Dipeptidyl-peptidase n=1 Tax=Coprinellus micaceus TaxID=71717 RepID=A0A4Y7SBB3_COPMI|nr:dipeptidyl-peptidase [Coprinellus micaceus]
MRQASQTTLVDPALIRPKVYYNDGPFDAPSSSDEEAESLLGDEHHEEVPLSPGMVELGGTSPRRRGKGSTTSTPLRFLLVGIAILVGLACVIGVFAAMAYSVPDLHPKSSRITMDHLFNGTFSPERVSLHWVPEAGDGVFSSVSGGAIRLVDLKTQHSQDLVNLVDIRNEQGQPLAISSWQVSPDMKYILLKADYRKQWRWSSFGNYYVHNIETKSTHPIIPPTQPARTAFATWSPTGQAIAFVTDNDLYILPSAAPTTQLIRVTTSGNASLFHGVPDWVYEEEVFSNDYALWWSPDSRKVAFLALDETQVPEFSFPIYNPTEDSDAVIPYTSDVVMKYPKPGYPNPLVSVHVFDLDRYLDEHDIDDDEVATAEFPAVNQTLTLDWENRHPVTDSIIFEVTWVGNSSLIVKELNRNGNDGHVVHFDLDAPTALQRTTGKVVRKLGKNGEHGDDGWVESEQTIFPLRNGESGATAYLDITPTPEGYNHIALFSPADSDKPHFLTSGPWEVTGGISAVDHKKGLVYFTSTKASSIERHIYSIALPKTKEDLAKKAEPVALTDDTKSAFYRASFSPEAGFHVLSYDGPGVPSQKVVQVDNSTFSYVLTTNERLKNVTEQYEAPTVFYTSFKNSEGYELNVKEIRPPRMDDSGRLKYPVLFKVYGGPGSQQVDQRFNRADWANYVACGLKTIVVIVDGRGTGFKGRKLRNPVKGNLGFFETIDQIEAAKEWAKKTYVDPKRIGIWGWSYGGFMSSKVAEADAKIHSLAMAVAPVTSWRLYDSIYTERYMNTPQLNPGGYVNASITNVTGFNHIDYLLAHGSGDDNVHYANSAHLLDMFTKAQVRKYRFRMFTDSDHSISRRGANREVYEYLTAFLAEKWGRGPRRRK